MARSSRAVLLLAVAMAEVLRTARGAIYTVGAPAGSWDLQTNYANWASSINFRAGDQLGNHLSSSRVTNLICCFQTLTFF
jgi:hypothetical protein